MSTIAKNEISTQFYTIDTNPHSETKILANIIIHLIKKQAMDLHDQLNIIKNEHFAKQRLSLKDNHDFINHLEVAFQNAEIERNKYKAWILEKKDQLLQIDDLHIDINDIIFRMNELFTGLNEFSNSFKNDLLTTFRQTDKVDYTVLALTPFNSKNLENNPELKDDSPKPIATKYVIFPPIEAKENDTPRDTISELGRSLPIWLSTIDEPTLKLLIQEAREPYDLKNRGLVRKVFSFIKPPRSHDLDDKPLDQIFATGGWESNSLNTQILKKLCYKMLQDTDRLHLISDKNDYWWGGAAKKIVDRSGILNGQLQLYNSENTKLEIEAKYY